MPCTMCQGEGPLDSRGLCPSCADKLAALSRGTADLSKQISETIGAEAVGGDRTPQPDEPRARAEPRSKSHRVVEFGQSDACSLRHPFSVATCGDNDVLVMDRPTRDSYRVSLFASDGEFLRTVFTCHKGSGPDELKLPKGIAADRHGNVYVPDAGNNRIQRFGPQGAPLGPIGAHGDGPGEMDFPCDVDVDDMGMLYVADTYNGRIHKLTPQGVLLLTIHEGCDPSGGEPLPLDEPLGVTADAQGNIYVADTKNHRVLKYDPEGRWLFTFGEQGGAPGQFIEPTDVRVMDDGLIYVADANNTRVQRFGPAGDFRAEFSLEGGELPPDVGGDVAVDSDGLLILCDPNKHTVAKVEFLDDVPPGAGETS